MFQLAGLLQVVSGEALPVQRNGMSEARVYWTVTVLVAPEVTVSGPWVR